MTSPRLNAHPCGFEHTHLPFLNIKQHYLTDTLSLLSFLVIHITTSKEKNLIRSLIVEALRILEEREGSML